MSNIEFNITQNPTPYPDVNAVLHDLLLGVQDTLGDYFIGMYLGGSLAAGDFDPQRSDIDFLVITTDELPEDVVVALQVMHDRIATGRSKWTRELEGCYISRQSVRRYDPDKVRYPMIERYDRLSVYDSGPDQVVQRYIIREKGIILAGPSPETLIDPVSPDDLHHAVLGILRKWWIPMLNGPSVQMNGSGYRAYAVLSMCRILYTLENKRIVSKPIAAEWAKQKLGQPWASTIDCASTWIEGATPVGMNTALDIIRYTVGLSR